MDMSWVGKPCAKCGGNKGPKYATLKHCGKCAKRVRKDQQEARHDQKVAATYGIGRGGYATLYLGQDGRCWICRRATGATRRLSVDHDHVTGEVRGLLCRLCNDMLGHARDDPAMFRRATEYLEAPPAPRILARVGTGTPGTLTASTALSGGR